MLLPLRSAALLALLVLTALALAACEDGGLKIGTFHVIKPKHPLVASSFELTRRQASPATPTMLVNNQKLVVQLTDGRVSFTDTDGKIYPGQLTPQQLEQLRSLIANRDWQIGIAFASHETKGVTNYGLTVFNGDKPVSEQAFWAEPPQKPLPEVIHTLENTLNQAERLAHPLSNQVDLLK